MKNKIFVDIGNSYIKIAKNDINDIIKFKINDLIAIENYISQNHDCFYYIGSVNKKSERQIISMLTRFNIEYYLITHNDFKNIVKLNSNINIEEVGLDILSIVYGINDYDYIFINVGTALLFIKYSNQLDGVIIAPNIFYNMEELLNTTNLNFNYINHNDFGIDNDQAFSAAINLQFVEPLNKLIKRYHINKIYYHSVDEKIMKNIEANNIKKISDATIIGYIKLIK